MSLGDDEHRISMLFEAEERGGTALADACFMLQERLNGQAAEA